MKEYRVVSFIGTRRSALMEQGEPKEWLTTEQVAQFLQVNPETVRRWVRAGELPVLRVGGPKSGYRIRRSDLDAYIEEHFGLVKKRRPRKGSRAASGSVQN
jgi:excisionase family DNA binding protein